ncbi:hypothetical protein C5167_043496 [Papaver somniferum]|uniref:Uncharacterized protein n=1 Tax=Papaver somniferum TaxID=3469 RepID=A0A4Y7L8C5_PAPSO|nr:hypothetical protein C5167_043496 [Papaver somniferum]
MISFFRFPDHYEKNVKGLVLAMALITKPKDNHHKRGTIKFTLGGSESRAEDWA